MRTMILGFGFLLVTLGAVHAATHAELASAEFSVGAWVDVDATGKAHVVEMDALDRLKDENEPGSLGDIIKSRLRERIESWQFEPPTKNGVAVSGRTHVNLTVAAEDTVSGDLRLQVKRASTGSVVRQMPSFLPLIREMRTAEGWKGLIRLEIDTQGHVTQARMIDSRVLSGGRYIAARGYQALTKDALKISKQIEFEMERVDGQPIAGGGDLPIRFCLNEAVACKDAIADESEAGDEDQTEFAATDPAIGLRTAVAGTVL